MTDSHEDNDKARLQELLDEKCNGSLGPEGFAELNEILAKSAELRTEYWDLIGIHADLEWELAGKEASDNEILSLLPADSEPASESTPANRAWPIAPIHRVSWGSAAIAAGILAVLLGGWGLWYRPQDERAGRVAQGEQGASDPTHVAAQLAPLATDSRWSSGRPGVRNPQGIQLGDTVWVEQGVVEMSLEGGTTGQLRAPAIMQLVSERRVRLLTGHIKVEAPEQAQGFTVETPSAEVVDLGTVFSVEAAKTGTDLVVFDGKVDLKLPSTDLEASTQTATNLRFTTGQAVRVDKNGILSRIMSVHTSTDPMALSKPDPSAVIVSVADNIRGENWAFYEIALRGMAEDTRAYVDRFHEWNGVTPEGMPSYLLGGDYVKMFNDDKALENYRLEVTLSRPSVLYVLLDKRVPPPEWLTSSFSDTGDEIGVDESPYDTANRFQGNEVFAQVGPGISIDRTHSIWMKVVPEGGTVYLGPNGQLQEPGDDRAHYIRANMYGIVAVPLYDAVK